MPVITIVDIDKKLFRKCIDCLLDGFPLFIEDAEYKYFRRSAIIEEDDGSAYRVLENGIFKRCNRHINFSNSGIWLRTINLDEVDFLYETFDKEEKERLYMDICFMMAMEENKK